MPNATFQLLLFAEQANARASTEFSAGGFGLSLACGACLLGRNERRWQPLLQGARADAVPCKHELQVRSPWSPVGLSGRARCATTLVQCNFPSFRLRCLAQSQRSTRIERVPPALPSCLGCCRA